MMNNITEEEGKVIEELRNRTINDVTPKMLEDVSLFYRFAKARDFNLTDAEAMLRKHIAWRKEFKIDTILTDYNPPEVLVKYGPTNFICFDKVGSVVRHIDCGRTDAKGLWNSVEKTELGKYFAYFMERDKDMMIKKGTNLGNTPLYTAVYNFEGLTYTNAISLKSLQYLSYVMKMFIDNYPESITRLLVINAPLYFTWIYSALKSICPKSLLQKIQMYGAEGWKEDLLKLADAENLPAFLGGTKTDPDGNPKCETFILYGQPIPRSYYMTKERKKSALLSDAEKLSVKPFSREEINFEVIEENSCLEWEFEIKNKDIDFSLIFKRKSEENMDPVEIIPRQRIHADNEPEKGCFKCEETGIYTMVFDNIYSWLHPKEIYFRAKIKAPKNDETKSLS